MKVSLSIWCLRDFSWLRCILTFQLPFLFLVLNHSAFLWWLGWQAFLYDLSSLDPDFYNGLIFLKHYTGKVEELSLNFKMVVKGMLCISSLPCVSGLDWRFFEAIDAIVLAARSSGVGVADQNAYIDLVFPTTQERCDCSVKMFLQIYHGCWVV